jgi:hypothetical protein
MNRLTKSETIKAQSIMASLSKAGFKPGSLKSKATASFTKSLSAKCIRTVARLNQELCTIGDVESYDARTKRSSDFLGVIDLIAVTPTLTRGIQACGTDLSTHITKIKDGDCQRKTEIWLSSPTRTFEIWSWRQYKAYKKDGTQAKTSFWWPRIQLITLDFLAEREPPTMLSFAALMEGATPLQAIITANELSEMYGCLAYK